MSVKYEQIFDFPHKLITDEQLAKLKQDFADGKIPKKYKEYIKTMEKISQCQSFLIEQMEKMKPVVKKHIEGDN